MLTDVIKIDAKDVEWLGPKKGVYNQDFYFIKKNTRNHKTTYDIWRWTKEEGVKRITSFRNQKTARDVGKQLQKNLKKWIPGLRKEVL